MFTQNIASGKHEDRAPWDLGKRSEGDAVYAHELASLPPDSSAASQLVVWAGLTLCAVPGHP